MRVFEDLADLQAQTLETGQFVMIKGGNSANDGGTAFFQIVGSGAGVVSLANGNEAAPVGFGFTSPTTYGAVGDGTTVDNAAVQDCVNNERFVIIDKVFALDENTVNVPKDCHITCIGDGQFKYVGAITNPLATVLNIQSESFGDLVLDGNNIEFQGIKFDNSKSYVTRGNRCIVRNMYTDTLPFNTPIAVFNSSSEIDVQRIECYDFDQGASVTNGSVPQGFVTSNGGISRVGSVYGKNVHALVLPATDTDEVHIGHIVHEEGKDQAIYNLGGTLTFGQLDAIDCTEEIVVNRATLIGGDINVVGFGFPVLRIETAEYTKVGNIHGAYPRGTAAADIPENVPRGILGFRINNAGFQSGPVIIESVTGTFNRLLARTGDGVGTCESLRIGSIDCDLYFRGSDSSFAFDNWWDLRGAEKITLGDCSVRIRDIEDFVNSGNPEIFSDIYYDGTYPMAEDSHVESFRVKIYDSSDNINPFATYQGQRGDSLLRFRKAVWQTNAGPYRREDNLADDNVTISPDAPADGYWTAGQVLRNQNFDGGSNDDNNIIEFICTASGTPGTWLTYTPFKDQTGSPVGAVTPDFRGQIYRQLSSTNVFVSVGLTNSDWIQIGEEV